MTRTRTGVGYLLWCNSFRATVLDCTFRFSVLPRLEAFSRGDQHDLESLSTRSIPSLLWYRRELLVDEASDTCFSPDFRCQRTKASVSCQGGSITSNSGPSRAGTSLLYQSPWRSLFVSGHILLANFAHTRGASFGETPPATGNSIPGWASSGRSASRKRCCVEQPSHQEHSLLGQQAAISTSGEGGGLQHP